MSKFREGEIVEEIILTTNTPLMRFEELFSSIGVITYDKTWDEEDKTWLLTFANGEDCWIFDENEKFKGIV
jgi:hypothetical protein